MAAQLRLVKEDKDTETFRADARLRLWGAAVCALAAIGFAWLGYGKSLAAVVAAFVAAAFLFWSAWLALSFAGRRAVRYALSPLRIEIEKGIFAKRYESIELWRVRDVTLDQ